MSEKASCPKCGKQMLWVKTMNDRNMPLDMGSVERRFVIDPRNNLLAKERNVYFCHFDTCKKGFGQHG